MHDAESRYHPALELYRSTDMSIKDICRLTGVSVYGFRSYVQRTHRPLLFARHGLEVSEEEAGSGRLRKKRGQSPATHAKYREAIEACDDMAYIELNVSQIAYMFHLNPTALSYQLRNHYPHIQERRERERRRLGVSDNFHRGVMPWCTRQYAEAVEHLRTSDDTIRRTAELFNVSFAGLREHVLCYHKELTRRRADKRERAADTKERGKLTGNGMRHDPKPQMVEKYREAVELYRDSALTLRQIADRTGVSLSGLRNHLRIWHGDLAAARHGVDGAATDIARRYLKSTAEKYAEAIRKLKDSGGSTAEVAGEFGLNPDTFRSYLREHEPQLSASLGMATLPDGRQVLARSAQKYEEAIRLFATTTETLKSIAARLGLTYNSVGGYVRRNHPEAIEAHNRLLREEASRKEAGAAPADNSAAEREAIIKALQEAGGHKRNAARLLGISKSTLYNKLKALNLP